MEQGKINAFFSLHLRKTNPITLQTILQLQVFFTGKWKTLFSFKRLVWTSAVQNVIPQVLHLTLGLFPLKEYVVHSKEVLLIYGHIIITQDILK